VACGFVVRPLPAGGRGVFAMYVLALDTTTRDGSVALVDDHHVIEERRGDASRGHAERLPHELTTLAAAHALTIGEVGLFAVAAGPGSFTGLRIGIATIQGLAVATSRRVVAVSALEALAQSVEAQPGTLVAAWMDARRHDVFTALYRIADAPVHSPVRLVEVEGPAVGHPDATLSRWSAQFSDARVTFAGDGAALYADAITRVNRAGWTAVNPTPLLAGTIGRMAVARALAGSTIDPAAVQPLYVRRPDAEVDRERRAPSGNETFRGLS
jgi:tRNA threonylcarbamoyladenosine biosynthesis protein TsaB